ncbi:uncharacterized protein LOC119677499 [Teleopsis dalmanni]|uniref:uncharacterized protein LOC119677499 n=1 Tax=Teleopsis dalmanni TaxID=139649 RepID=UPI0018CDC7EE|nr:uncharacterized protein LOC119677499 [Teleopsis dalmanni]
MAATWCCTRNIIKLVLVCIVVAKQITFIQTLESDQSIIPRNLPKTQTEVTNQQSNSLLDEIEHEEFIDNDSKQPHSRRKRLVWITDDGRLALPPGTTLTITPTIALPLVRHPPEGFFSNVSISFPLTIDFDKLGLTDNQNPLGDLPPLFSRSFGHAAGHMLGEYVSRYLHYKKKRDLSDEMKPKFKQNSYFNIKEEEAEEDKVPKLPERFKHVFHGGERVMLYNVVEDFLSTFGMNGKACLLRTICEVHSRNLDNFGVFGEIVKLFLTVTKSPYSSLLPEYVRAQEIGEGREGPGECFPYYKECPKSIFKALEKHKYSEPTGEYHEQEVEEIISQKLPEELRNEDLQTNEIKENLNDILTDNLISM